MLLYMQQTLQQDDRLTRTEAGTMTVKLTSHDANHIAIQLSVHGTNQHVVGEVTREVAHREVVDRTRSTGAVVCNPKPQRGLWWAALTPIASFRRQNVTSRVAGTTSAT